MRFAILAASSALMAGCAMAPPPGCPAIRPYDQEFRQQLAGEVHGLPANSALRTALADYWTVRAEALECAN